MTQLDLISWLKAQAPELSGKISAGGIDGNRPQWLGVYRRKLSGKQRICVGGLPQTGYLTAGFTLLIHWGKVPGEAERQALRIYELFHGLSQVQMGEAVVVAADPGAGIVPVGKDDEGICEYVIELTVFYERPQLPPIAAGLKTDNERN